MPCDVCCYIGFDFEFRSENFQFTIDLCEYLVHPVFLLHRCFMHLGIENREPSNELFSRDTCWWSLSLGRIVSILFPRAFSVGCTLTSRYRYYPPRGSLYLQTIFHHTSKRTWKHHGLRFLTSLRLFGFRVDNFHHLFFGNGSFLGLRVKLADLVIIERVELLVSDTRINGFVIRTS